MSRRKFVVKSPSAISNMIAGLIILIILFNIIYTIFNPPPHTAMYISFSVLVMPFLLGMIKLKFFSVTVSGSTINVRKGLIRRFSCDVSDITQIVWRITKNNIGIFEKVDVRVGRKKFSVETLMENSDKFYAFLKENVDPDIIHERRKNLVKEKVDR